jgi:prolyl oligopeptidase
MIAPAPFSGVTKMSQKTAVRPYQQGSAIITSVRRHLGRLRTRSAILLAASITVGPGAFGQSKLAAPPKAAVRDTVDNYFGTAIRDPYRYMETSTPEAIDWFRAQREYTDRVLSMIPQRDQLRRRLEQLDGQLGERFQFVTELPGGRYLYSKSSARDSTYRLYVRRGFTGAERMLVDPERFREPGGPAAALNAAYPSPDGRLLAYTVPAGSERTLLHIMNTVSGTDVDRPIPSVLSFGAVSWSEDASAFFYMRLPALAAGSSPSERYLNAAVYRHVLGTDAARDRLVIGPVDGASLRSEPGQWPSVYLPVESRWAIAEITNGVGTKRMVYVSPRKDAESGEGKWRQIVSLADEVTEFSVHGDDLYLITQRDAPRGRVAKLALPNGRLSDATTVIHESAAAPTGIGASRDAFYVVLRQGPVGSLIRLPYSSGRPERVPLPMQGIPQLYSTDPRFDGALFTVQGWTRGAGVYAWRGHSIRDTNLRPESPSEQKLKLAVINAKVISHDGTTIPLTIIGPRGFAPDGANMVYLLGYGSYGASMDPLFDPFVLTWYEKGGIVAVAHVRGGGEYGEEWHRAGQKAAKGNTWKDFIACAEYLIRERYTRPGRLAGAGVSAGGILIGRAITERPELFGAALIGSGTTDMLRAEFQKNGAVNIPEFGTVKSADDFPALLGMSAYHHVKDGIQYPAVLLSTGTNDPVVDSWQPAKMAARLQAATASGRPVLLRVDDAGHDQWGATKSQLYALRADQLAFLLWQLRDR